MNSPSWVLGSARNPDPPVWILHVSGAAGDHAFLRGILKQPKWQLHHVRNCWEARNVLHTCRVNVVLSDVRLSDGDWKNLLAATSSSGKGPALVVYSRHTDDRLCAEVLNLGGHDLLVQPFEASELERVLDSASRATTPRTAPAKRGEATAGVRAAYSGE